MVVEPAILRAVMRRDIGSGRNNRKRHVARQSYQGEERWTRCPSCGEYFAWLSNGFQGGLKGRRCRCSYAFTGYERNPTPKRCTIGDGVVHEAWCASEARSYVYSVCQVNPTTRNGGASVSPNAKPMPATTEVTCMLCISLEGLYGDPST